MTLYNPRHFNVTNHGAAFEFISNYDFAIVVSHGELHATHSPMTASRADEKIELFGHFARKNPHCELLNNDTQHTCIFAGPHTYVSPAWYVSQPAVPTWNYSAVHITGTAKVIADEEALRQYLLALTRKNDPTLDIATHMPEKFMNSMMKGIVGFTLEAEQIEFKQKLSQNRTVEDRRAVAQALTEQNDQDARSIAMAMQPFLD